MITTALCVNTKRDFLKGEHRPEHVYKIALFKANTTQTWNHLTAAYVANLNGDEVVGTGYAAGGNVLTGYICDLFETTGYLDFDDTQWLASTILSDGAMIYNDSLPGKPSLAVFSFGGTVGSTNGPFIVHMPSSGPGVIRIA